MNRRWGFGAVGWGGRMRIKPLELIGFSIVQKQNGLCLFPAGNHAIFVRMGVKIPNVVDGALRGC